jgi:hypothetical protein
VAAPRDPERPFQTAEQAGQRLAELAAHRQKLTIEILRLEGDKVRPVQLAERTASQRRATALSLLASDAAITEVENMRDDMGMKLACLNRARFDLDAAAEAGNQIMQQLAASEVSERMQKHGAEYRKAMRAVALAIIALEHAQQERDRIARDVLKAPRPDILAGGSWELLGRIGRHGGQAYRFLHIAATEGWISQAELADELARADKS